MMIPTRRSLRPTKGTHRRNQQDILNSIPAGAEEQQYKKSVAVVNKKTKIRTSVHTIMTNNDTTMRRLTTTMMLPAPMVTTTTTTLPTDDAEDDDETSAAVVSLYQSWAASSSTSSSEADDTATTTKDSDEDEKDVLTSIIGGTCTTATALDTTTSLSSLSCSTASGNSSTLLEHHHHPTGSTSSFSTWCHTATPLELWFELKRRLPDTDLPPPPSPPPQPLPSQPTNQRKRMVLVDQKNVDSSSPSSLPSLPSFLSSAVVVAVAQPLLPHGRRRRPLCQFLNHLGTRQRKSSASAVAESVVVTAITSSAPPMMRHEALMVSPSISYNCPRHRPRPSRRRLLPKTITSTTRDASMDTSLGLSSDLLYLYTSHDDDDYDDDVNDDDYCTRIETTTMTMLSKPSTSSSFLLDLGLEEKDALFPLACSGATTTTSTSTTTTTTTKKAKHYHHHHPVSPWSSTSSSPVLER